MKRRTIVIASAAAVATAAGLATAIRRAQPDSGAQEADIWRMTFDTPRGARLEVASLRGKPLLLNFWATWCPPCVSEMPLLDRFFAQQRGAWQVLGLAVDNLEPVNGFLERRPVAYPIGLAGSAGVTLSRSLGNSTGALPFSVVFDSTGQLVDRRLGVIEPQHLERWVASA